jgi:hypothetical protein
MIQDANLGVPSMFFICSHKCGHEQSGQTVRMLVSGNAESWGDLEGVHEIRRRARDARVREYSAAASAAFYKLKGKEDEALEKQMPTKNIGDARSIAISAMREEEEFLGRTTESGQAFNSKTLTLNRCCYACQGMMGYLVVKRFNSAQIRKYHEKWDWVQRGDYAHSCAEITVSQQCSEYHMKDGREWNA